MQKVDWRSRQERAHFFFSNKRNEKKDKGKMAFPTYFWAHSWCAIFPIIYVLNLRNENLKKVLAQHSLIFKQTSQFPTLRSIYDKVNIFYFFKSQRSLKFFFYLMVRSIFFCDYYNYFKIML